MKFSETISAQARYGDVAALAFSDHEIIFENSERDYSGLVYFLAVRAGVEEEDWRRQAPFIAVCAWSYGSCAGCDAWEAADLCNSEILSEILNATTYYKGVEAIEGFLELCARQEEDFYWTAEIIAARKLAIEKYLKSLK